MGADRLAAAADPHGAVLGGAADPPPELPLHLSIRAGTGAALAVRRAAPTRAPADRPADPADQGLPRSAVLRRGLPHRCAVLGLRRRGRPGDGRGRWLKLLRSVSPRSATCTPRPVPRADGATLWRRSP